MNRVFFFSQFLILGVGLGIVEDVIAVYWATATPITWKIVLLIVLVAIPFAALGELVVDKIDIPFLGRKTELFLEFFIFGFLVGIVEDLLAIFISTGQPVTLRVVLIAAVVALPFAVFSELIVDRFKFDKS